MAKKFLIGQLACFGDCLYATTIAKQIKHDYPGSHVTWAIANKYKSILEGNPHVDVVWEVPIHDGDFYTEGWKKFEREALQRQADGEFDEIIFSQIAPLNWIKFNGLLRNTILKSYNNPITVSANPVVKLSSEEIENVESFAKTSQLQNFKHVVLFECAPGSSQSKINIEVAIEICNEVVADNPEVCFILSTPKKLSFSHPQILDASTLTYRENVALTQYCTLLIGCSSGITWLSTSDSAKRLPMIQLLDEHFMIYSGVEFDLKVNRIDGYDVIELTRYDKRLVAELLHEILLNNFAEVKKKYHQIYKPEIKHLYNVGKMLAGYNTTLNVLKFAYNYIRFNKVHGNKLHLNYMNFIKQILLVKYNNKKENNSIFRSLDKMLHPAKS